MDNELSGSDRETLVKRLIDDPELKKRWSRYHLISDVLHNNLPENINPDLSPIIAKRLESEPTILAPKRSNFMAPIAKKAAGVAIAASVALGTVLTVQMFSTETGSQPAVAQMPDSSEFVRLEPASSGASNASSTIAINPTPASHFNPQLNKYLRDHNQSVTITHVQGVMPYARIVVSPVEKNQASTGK